jgi:hypothetical protein
MNKEKTESLLAWVVGILFGIAAGFIIWFLAVTYHNHHAARSWVAVPARVLSVEMHRTRSSSSARPGSTIWNERLEASYRYVFKGTEQTGSRVDFSFGADNFSGKRRAQQLSLLRADTVEVFVDPGDPAESVLDRSLPANQVIFALIFLLFPCGVGTAFISGMLVHGLDKLGWSEPSRYFLPLLGLLHGAPALYPLIFAPGSLGLFGWLVVLALTTLCGYSLLGIWRRMSDPSVGQPTWPPRLARIPTAKNP